MASLNWDFILFDTIYCGIQPRPPFCWGAQAYVGKKSEKHDTPFKAEMPLHYYSKDHNELVRKVME